MPRFNANLTLLFNEVEFLERFRAARDAGFEGVEYLFPYAHRKQDLAERLQANGLTQVLHNVPAGAWAGGTTDKDGVKAENAATEAIVALVERAGRLLRK